MDLPRDENPYGWVYSTVDELLMRRIIDAMTHRRPWSDAVGELTSCGELSTQLGLLLRIIPRRVMVAKAVAGELWRV